MNKNKTVNRGERTPLRRAIIAGLAGVALAFILLIIAALCMEHMILPQSSAMPVGRIVLIISAFCAAYMGCRKGEGSRAVRGGVSAAALLVFVIFTAVLTKTSSVFNMSLLWNFLCIICGSAGGVLLTARRSKRRRRRI